ncbi:unnamed protein product [Penicillium salamii]|nr:unnamed protein product [Penicillium salamii]CAG8283196.1 unnamed protein product [Penicillium salamii]
MIFAILVVVILIAFCVFHAEYQHRNGIYPPGPRPLPFIGNLHQIPRTDQWRKFKKWHEIYGPVISVYLGQQRVIILGSHDCVRKLLINRGVLYSSRPEYYSEGVGSHFHNVALPYGRQWRRQREILNSFLSPRHCKSYRILQDLESKQLINDLLSTNDFSKCFHRVATNSKLKKLTGSCETFVLASLLHKNAVTTAQAEVDSVTGLRMPGWDDLPRLPYVNAFINEVLRWRPVVPGGLHHAVTEDDYYLGFKIPKGTPVIPNHWSLELDETHFPDPETFEPKRWIENPDIPSSAFGFGRRICPGKPMARNSLAVIVARMLWAFHFDPVYDHGEKNEVDSWSMTQGISSRPKPFKVSLVPRSLAHQEVIRYQWKISEKGDEGLMAQVESGIAENRAADTCL